MASSGEKSLAVGHIPGFQIDPKSARTVSERFFGQSRHRKRRNTVCTRKGYAASVSRLMPATAALYFPFPMPKSGRKRSAHSRRRFIQSFLRQKLRRFGLCRESILRAEIVRAGVPASGARDAPAAAHGVFTESIVPAALPVQFRILQRITKALRVGNSAQIRPRDFSSAFTSPLSIFLSVTLLRIPRSPPPDLPTRRSWNRIGTEYTAPLPFPGRACKRCCPPWGRRTGWLFRRRR